jgi:anti-sigma factor RsiW
MTVDPQARQQLLELVYGLLPESEAEELRARIAADPELQQAYADAQATSSLLADAARLKAPKLDPKRLGRVAAATPARPTPGVRRGDRHRSYWAVRAGWTVGLSAAVLLAASLGGYFYHRHQFAELAAAHLRLLVTGPARLQAGAANSYTINTSLVTGEPVGAQVEFAVYSPQNKAILRQEERTDPKTGTLQWALPANVQVPPGARLELGAVQNRNRAEVSTTLDVEPARYLTYLNVDRPRYEPGQTVRYRSLTLSRFSLAADREFAVQYAVHDPQGNLLAGSTAHDATQQGVASGSFTLPGNAIEGEYSLVVRSPQGGFPEEAVRFDVAGRHSGLETDLEFTRARYAPGDKVVGYLAVRRADGAPARGAHLQLRADVDGHTVWQSVPAPLSAAALRIEFPLPSTINRGDSQLTLQVQDHGVQEQRSYAIPVRLNKVEVAFYPESGPLVAGLPNRVYFTSRDALGKPVALRGVIVDRQNRELVEVETTYDGRGLFNLTPEAAEQYRLKILSPENIAQQPALPLVASQPKILLNTGAGLFEAGQPLEFDITSLQAERPLLVSATCRGVPVGQTTLVTKVSPHGQRCAIALPPDVGGVVRLTVYDYGHYPPLAIAGRLVYRRTNHRLQVQFAGLLPSYTPNSRVALSLRAEDEKGAPAPANLGVTVAAASPPDLPGPGRANLVEYFLLASELDDPQTLTGAHYYLSDAPLANIALDLLLGTQGSYPSSASIAENGKPKQPGHEPALVAAGSTPAGPPAVFDNLSAIRAKYEQSLQAYHTDQAQRFHVLTTLSFFGGFALVLFVGMLAILNIISGVRVWVPALGAALCCLIVGAVLMNPDRLQPGMQAAVAFMPYHVTPTEVAMADQVASHKAAAQRATDALELDAVQRDAEKPGGSDRKATGSPQGKEKSPPPAFAEMPAPGLAESLSGQPVEQRKLVQDKAPRREASKAVDEPAVDHPSRPTPTVAQSFQPHSQARPTAKRALEKADATVSEAQPAPSVMLKSSEVLPAPPASQASSSVAAAAPAAAPAEKQLLNNPGEIAAKGDKNRRLFKGAPFDDLQAADRPQSGLRPDNAAAARSKAASPGGGALNLAPRTAGLPTGSEPELRWNSYSYSNALNAPLGQAVANSGQGGFAGQMQTAVNAGQQFGTANGAFANGNLGYANSAADGLNNRNLGTTDLRTNNPFQRNDASLDQQTVRRAEADNRGRGQDKDVSQQPAEAAPLLFWHPNMKADDEGRATATFDLPPAVARYRVRVDAHLGGRIGHAETDLVADLPHPALAPVPSPVTANGQDRAPSSQSTDAAGVATLHSESGTIERDRPLVLDVPEQALPGTLQVSLHLFPSPLAELQQANAALLAESPAGFGSAAAAVNLAALANDYLESGGLTDPGNLLQWKNSLAQNYQAWKGYECPTGGYDWFGGASPQAALTAYGLLVLTDASRTGALESGHAERLAHWLLSRRDGKGSYLADAAGQMPPPLQISPDLADATITGALAAAGQKGIDMELQRLVELGPKAEAPGLIALTAVGLQAAGMTEPAQPLLEKLATAQQADGHLPAQSFSATVQATALAIRAWLSSPAYLSRVQHAIDWLRQTRQSSGSFGSPQATALAMQAIVEYAKAHWSTVHAGKLVVHRDGSVIGELSFAAGEQSMLVLEGLQKGLKPGKNQLVLSLTGGNRLPYTISVRYRTAEPLPPRGPLQLSVAIHPVEVKLGQTAQLSALLSNESDAPQPLPLLLLGLPAGMEASAEQLQQMKRQGVLADFVVRPRDVVCYWRWLEPGAKVFFKLDLAAATAGKYRAASRAYLSDNPEQAAAAKPIEIEISRP